LQRIRLALSAENEQCEPGLIDPDVIADRLHVFEHQSRIRPVEIETPETLGAICFDADDRKGFAIRCDEGRVLALWCSRHLRDAGHEVIAIDVRLLAIPIGREQQTRAVRHETGLVVIARVVADILRRTDWRNQVVGESREIHLGRRLLGDGTFFHSFGG
jgi:hypothetical protein